MSVGSKYKFYVPYALGYGEKGAGNGAIPGFSTLIFEVQLLDIKKLKETAPSVEAKPSVAPKVVRKSAKRAK